MNDRICIVGLSIILCVFYFPVRSVAEEIQINKKYAEKDNQLDWCSRLVEKCQYDLRILGSFTWQDISESSQNPDNNFLRLPSYIGRLEFRPDVAFNHKDITFTMKPRLEVERQVWKEGSREDDEESDYNAFINEWLLRLSLDDRFFISYGRENLQWGPAYLFSPSNPFFRDNGRSNPKKEVPGMDFVRAVWLPAVDWTISFIANVDEGRQDFGLYGFKKTYALKIDYSGQDGCSGLILSGTERSDRRLGVFTRRTVSDALLLYGEGVLIGGSDALYPRESINPFGLSMETKDKEYTDLDQVVLLGGQYTLEMGPTFSVEYIYNGLGYGDELADDYYRLRDLAANAYSTGGPLRDLGAMTLAKTADPKLRFLRRHYLMLQYNQNDIRDILSLTLRWTQNLEDGSGQFVSIFELFIGDHTQIFSVGSFNIGSSDEEFGSPLDHQLMLGIEYVF
ncbi:MAG: hypothetical protein ACMUIM_12360 [bacterium]